MAWEIEYTNEFEEWWDGLTLRQQQDFTMTVDLLIRHGPLLPFPHSSGARSSRHSRMRELRGQSGGQPLRAFYAFDPRRTAILLIGGVKTDGDRFYERHVPAADRLYDEHLEELREEGLIP